ncbi:hypothetical protein EDB89DRAFT_1961678 [Lactarius sanguifluus]|nr:hypothetical protein EDB89DRAFT_1961678 [Lactarius sanguifluus]
MHGQYLSEHIDGSPLSLLTIPNSEAERLSIYPFKWIRYVMFSICGAFGDLSPSLAPASPSVNYNSTSLSGAIDLYYNPSECCSPRNYVIKRDGSSCVITGRSAEHCDAAHIMPRSKSDEYILKVVEDRLALYYPPPLPISGVNDIQNGVLLNSDLHRLLSAGEITFLKTPNYGLDPTDVRRLERGPAGTDHITLHQLMKPKDDSPDMLETLKHSGTPHPHAAFVFGAHVDALFNSTDPSLPLPHDVVLDYMYGVAAYKRWKSTAGIHDVMKSYHEEHYAHIPGLPRKPPSDNTPEPDDPRDTDCIPTPRQRHHPSTSRGDVMAEAIDDLNTVLMYINGTTPEEVAERREKRMEEEERAAQERSRNKVTEWMRYKDVVGS